MFNMMTLPYTPKAISFAYKRSAMIPLLAMYVFPITVSNPSSDADSSAIHIYNARDDGTPLHTLDKIHSRPVHIISYNAIHDCVLSADIGGMLEYWQPTETFAKPPSVFSFKSQTDLYDFKKSKSMPSCLTFSRDGSKFVSQSFPDRQIRIFNFRTGKCLRKYDESISTISELQDSESTFKLDTMTFGARLSADRELEKTTSLITSANVIFDESGHFIIYATLLGIKIVNTVTNRMVRLLGKDETHRFTNLALYQGAPKKKEIHDLAMAASENPLLAESEAEDPILFCTAFRKARFFMFTAGMEEYPSVRKMRLMIVRRAIGMCTMRDRREMIVLKLRRRLRRVGLRRLYIRLWEIFSLNCFLMLRRRQWRILLLLRRAGIMMERYSIELFQSMLQSQKVINMQVYDSGR